MKLVLLISFTYISRVKLTSTVNLSHVFLSHYLSRPFLFLLFCFYNLEPLFVVNLKTDDHMCSSMAFLTHLIKFVMCTYRRIIVTGQTTFSNIVLWELAERKTGSFLFQENNICDAQSDKINHTS